MPNINEIKAIFSLLESEPSHREQLLKSLAVLYKENPTQVYALAKEYYGEIPFDLKKLFKENQTPLETELKSFLNLRNPNLVEGLILIAKIINPKAQRGQILQFFNFSRDEFDKIIDASFDINQKAQILQNFFFETLAFEIKALSKDTALLNLPEIFKNFKTTPFVMAVLYLIFIYPYEVKADIIEAENKVIVRLRDAFSLEPVYIDIADKGHFVSEAECDMYAAGNFIKWNSNAFVPLTNRDIFKRLISNLIYISKEYNFLSVYLD